MVGRLDKSLDCHAHGPMACAQDIDAVDLDRINDADTPSDFRIGDQFAIDFLT
jgi:hypothetical protein